MFKVYPDESESSSSSSSSISNLTSTRESYTIWMKSLLFHGCGCTIFNSNGDVVYRVDNYDQKCRSKVYPMNIRGKVLLSLQRKKFQVFKPWNGFKWSGCEGVEKEIKPWFQVRKDCKILATSTTCNVSLAGCDHKAKGNCYRIVGSSLHEKSEFKIIRGETQIVAEVRRKQSSSGIVLGDDVLSLVVEPRVDHLLIMALVTVYGLINNKL